MYKPAAVACIFIILLASTAGCSILPATPNTTGKQGIAGEASTADLPQLPEQYVAPPLGTLRSGPTVTNPTLPERLPRILPEQRTTINGTGLSGNGTNASTTVTSTTISSASVPVAQFTANAALGYAPFTVQFMDSSLNTPVSWSWDFGDNSYSFLQNPSHTYNTGGQYRVILTAANAAGSSSFSNNTSVYAPGFSVSPDHGAAPLAVTLTNTGTGSPQPSTWLWDFGDGTTCASENKVHTYVLSGTYDVKFRVSGPAGTTWVNKTAAVTVT
jgi:PKD repeat protein